MSDYIEPTQTEFNSGEQAALDILSTAYPRLLTKPGSVLRELLVRPVAYVYAWLTANFNDMRRRTTVAYLKNSSATDDPVADAVASNYFVSRREGVRSKGIISIIINTPTTQLDAGSVFVVNGVELVTATRVIVMGTVYSNANGVQYVPSVPYDTYAGTYIAGIPVVAVETGRIEIAPGAVANANFANSSLVSALLTSPVSGGRATETDAELMARAEYNTAESGIGSYYGIKKKLAGAPVDVLGMSLVAGDDAPIYRARYNSLSINPGGFVDCHVKTYDQYAVDTIYTTWSGESSTEHIVEIYDAEHAGIFAVTAVTVGGEPVLAYSVAFGVTSGVDMPAEGARLGVYQTTLVTFSTTTAVSSIQDIAVTVMYMPGISSIQAYMDGSQNKFVGQSFMVKAAVPIVMTLACKMEYDGTPDDETLEGIRRCMADRVNAYEVGSEGVNFSDLQKAVRTTYPKAELRIPCSMTGSLTRRDGSVVGLYSTSGVLDAKYPAMATDWDPAICFYSLIAENIRLELI